MWGTLWNLFAPRSICCSLAKGKSLPCFSYLCLMVCSLFECSWFRSWYIDTFSSCIWLIIYTISIIPNDYGGGPHDFSPLLICPLIFSFRLPSRTQFLGFYVCVQTAKTHTTAMLIMMTGPSGVLEMADHHKLY